MKNKVITAIIVTLSVTILIGCSAKKNNNNLVAKEEVNLEEESTDYTVYTEVEKVNTTLKTPPREVNVKSSGTIYVEDYSGQNLNNKIKNMIDDVNKNYKNDVMEIVFPSGIIEINEDLIIENWSNKTITCPGVLYFKNCNAIEFKNLQQCDINIHRVSSEIPRGDSNPQGFISIDAVDDLNKNGLKFTDCSYNRININEILGFQTGLELYSEYGQKGTLYNDFNVGTIWRCQTGILLRSGKAKDDTANISGWVNENRFFNTMIDSNKGIVIGQDLESRPEGEPVDSYHNNKFYNIGFEKIRDKKDPVAIDMKQGVSNVFENPRFEGSLKDEGYIMIREGKDASLNLYNTSNYMMNINRIFLNTSSKKDNGTNQGKQMSMVNAALMKEDTAVLANKMTALKDKVIYEAYGIEDYNLINHCPNNLINYVYSDKEFIKYKDSKGKIKSIKFDNGNFLKNLFY